MIKINQNLTKWLVAGVMFTLGPNGLSQTVNHWETAVFSEDIWRYRVNESTLPSEWYGKEFNDSEWLQGAGGFGYEDGDDNTVVPACISVSIRAAFNIANINAIASAVLHVDFDDAFIAWINGVEVARSSGLTDITVQWDTPSTQSHEAVMYSGGTPQPFYIPASTLHSVINQGENVIAIEVHNSGINSSDLSVRPYLSFGISTSEQFFRSTPAWFVAPIENLESNLPLILINTHGQEILKDQGIVASMKVIDQQNTRNSMNDTVYSYNGSIHIEYHGQSSYYNSWPKKSFNVELVDSQENNIDEPLLGMPAGNDWVLYGPYNDKSLIRNALTYELSRRLGHYAPRTAFCEISVNNEYMGLYLLIEKIRRDKNRVDIAKLDSTDIEGDDLTGGYIVKIDKGDWSEFGWNSKYVSTNGYQINFYWHYPKAYKILPVQKEYIKKYIDTFEDVLMGADWNNPALGYYRYADMPACVDYFIINELSKNIDAYRISTFMHKDKDSKGGKLAFGPVWDYDLSFGNANYYSGESTSGWVVNAIDPNDYYQIPFWWKRFMQDDTFKSLAKCRWANFRKSTLNADSIFALIDEFTEKTAEARIRNFEKYPVFGVWVWPNAFVGNSYAEEIVYLKSFIAERLQWMDTYLPGTCTPGVTDTTDIYRLSVKAYPNPFTDKLNLVITLKKPDRVKVDMIDIAGHTVWSTVLEISQDTAIISLDNINVQQGLYLIRVTTDSKFVGAARLVKK